MACFNWQEMLLWLLRSVFKYSGSLTPYISFVKDKYSPIKYTCFKLRLLCKFPVQDNIYSN